MVSYNILLLLKKFKIKGLEGLNDSKTQKYYNKFEGFNK